MTFLFQPSRTNSRLESIFVRINRLACIVDEEEDLMEMSKPLAWCDTCEKTVILIEADKPLYKEI